MCLTSLLSNAVRFIPEEKLGQYSVLFWHKVDSIISLSRVEQANFFFFSQTTSRVTKFEAGLNFSIENHRQRNQPKFKIPSSKASAENPNASRPTPGKNQPQRSIYIYIYIYNTSFRRQFLKPPTNSALFTSNNCLLRHFSPTFVYSPFVLH